MFNIKLQSDTDQLEEVVIVGYGKQKRQAMVSSIATVGSRDLMQSSSSNLTSNLAGQLAGLISIQRSAEPGRDDAEFWIRGISTFKGGTNPLVLVDGIPRDINNIEADEIETFSILKDAAATAVYGAEGANGVILVTTKRGTISRPKISFRIEQSIASPQRLPEFVDSWDYLELANEAGPTTDSRPASAPRKSSSTATVRTTTSIRTRSGSTNWSAKPCTASATRSTSAAAPKMPNISSRWPTTSRTASSRRTPTANTTAISDSSATTCAATST